MSTHDKRVEQKHVEDAILDVFEDLEDLGVLNRKRTKYWFKQFGRVGLTGLIHKRRIRTVSKALKPRIKYRLGISDGSHKPNGKSIYNLKPNIPGPKVGEPNGVYEPPKAKPAPLSKAERSKKLGRVTL